MDCSLSASSVCGILQTRILEWVVIPFSRRSWLRDWTQVSCIEGRFCHHLRHQGSPVNTQGSAHTSNDFFFQILMSWPVGKQFNNLFALSSIWKQYHILKHLKEMALQYDVVHMPISTTCHWAKFLKGSFTKDFLKNRLIQLVCGRTWDSTFLGTS